MAAKPEHIGASTTNARLAQILAKALESARKGGPFTEAEIDAIDEAQQRIEETPDEE